MCIRDRIELDCCELSDLERQAEKASRTVVQQIICHHLKQFIGDDFDAMITGVTDFGIFAEIDNFYTSGLVHVSDLPDDRYIFDMISVVLKGKKSGKRFLNFAYSQYLNFKKECFNLFILLIDAEILESETLIPFSSICLEITLFLMDD